MARIIFERLSMLCNVIISLGIHLCTSVAIFKLIVHKGKTTFIINQTPHRCKNEYSDAKDD